MACTVRVLEQGAAIATVGSAAGSASEANAGDAATAQTGNPSSALGSAGAKAELGGNLEQPEAKAASAMQSAAHVHGNQAASDVPSQVNPPPAAQSRGQDSAAEQASAAAPTVRAVPTQEGVDKQRQAIEEWYTAEEAKARTALRDKLAELQRERDARFAQLDKDRTVRPKA